MSELKEILTKLSAEAPSGWLGIQLPRELKARMRMIHRHIRREDLAEKGVEMSPHVTVAYGLDPNLPDDVSEELLNLPRGRRLKLGKMDFFKTPEGQVLMFRVEPVDELSKVKEAVRERFGIPGETHKDYKPHATVAYLKDGVPLDRYRSLERMLEGKEFDTSKTRLRLGERRFGFGPLMSPEERVEELAKTAEVIAERAM